MSMMITILLQNRASSTTAILVGILTSPDYGSSQGRVGNILESTARQNTVKTR